MTVPALIDQYGNPLVAQEKAYSPASGYQAGWYPLIREPFGGAWQRNVHINAASVLAFHAVFACTTLIASDIAKLRVKLVEQGPSGIWLERTDPRYSPVLWKPNYFQNRVQFWENWMLSKLTTGNTYVLKQRDSHNIVRALYVLCPHRCRPLIADDGSVWYEI